MSIRVLDLELADPIQPLWGMERYASAQILIRHRGLPLGWVSVDNPARAPCIGIARISEAVFEQLGRALVAAAGRTWLGCDRPGRASIVPVSVVVCTRDRADLLEDCLRALLALDYPSYEIIVVDNSPSTDATARLAACLPVRYVREDRPGLDWARNRGLAEARHDIVAFTDDDVLADRGWLRALAAAFAEPEVMAVTGLVAPRELETQAQRWFEHDYGGLMQALTRRVVRRRGVPMRTLLWSNFGAGANMAFRRAVFDQVGPFDAALDVGTASGGGGDLDMLHRVVAGGCTLVYEPAALVWHLHRRTPRALSRQLRDNGRGFGCYLLACARNRTVSRKTILRFALRQWLGWWLLRRLLKPRGLPRRLVLSELAGAVSAPFAYRAARLAAARIGAGPKP